MALVEFVSIRASGNKVLRSYQRVATGTTERVGFVNDAEKESELEDLRSAAQRGRPFGAEDWMIKTAKQLGLISSLSPRGRPKLA